MSDNTVSRMCGCEREESVHLHLPAPLESPTVMRAPHAPPQHQGRQQGLPTLREAKGRAWWSRLSAIVLCEPRCSALLSPLGLHAHTVKTKAHGRGRNAQHMLSVGVYFPARRAWLRASWETARKQRSLLLLFLSGWQKGLREAAWPQTGSRMKALLARAPW